MQIKEARSGGRWAWSNQCGHITEVDKYCYTVRTDDGRDIRDVKEHFRRKTPC